MQRYVFSRNKKKFYPIYDSGALSFDKVRPTGL